MHRTIIVGSPREGGRSASLAEQIFEACIDECPNDGVSIVSVASAEVGPCMGCDACRLKSAPDAVRVPELPEEGDPLYPCDQVLSAETNLHLCVIEDEMQEVRKHIDAADELIIVCPVFFAGPPAQFKSLMDRLQPYYFTDLRKQEKRPITLHVVGEGGDPWGFDPLIGVVRSAFSVAGFKLERVLNWVGHINANGEIESEAEEYDFDKVRTASALESATNERVNKKQNAAKQRPKLKIS